MTTMAELVRARADDATTGLLFEDASWTYAEIVRAAAERAALLRELRRSGPFNEFLDVQLLAQRVQFRR